MPYMWNLKRHETSELIYKTETDSGRLRGRTYGCRGEEWRKWIVRELGMDMYTLLYLKWITNKDLLYSIGHCSMLCGRLDGRGV